MPVIKRESMFIIILLLISTMMALFIAEVSLRVLKIGYGTAPLESHPIFNHVHPAEYRFRSHIPSGEYGGHEIYYNKERLVSNPDGSIKSRDGSDCRVAFLGDSFTEGGQVAYKNSFVGLLEKYSHCEVKNFGVSSYSPILYLLQWRTVVKEFNPTLVVVQLYSNDMDDDKKYMKLARKNMDGKVVAVPGPGGGFITKQLRKSYLVRFLRKVQIQLLWMYENREDGQKNIVAGMVEENPDVPKLSEDIIKTLSSEVQSSGTQFVLTAIPSKFRLLNSEINSDNKSDPQFSDKWKSMAQKNGIAFLDLVDVFEMESKKGYRLFFDIDIHFEENGHALVASELSKLYPDLFQNINLHLNKQSIKLPHSVQW